MLDNNLVRNHRIQDLQWKPPSEDQVKVNIDTSFQKPNNRAVSGIIVRNNNGFVIGSCTYSIENIRDPTIVETYARLHEVAFAENLGFQYIILEGDPLNVVKKLQKNDDYIDRSVIGGIIDEIRNKARKFRSLMYRHIPQEANEAAHVIVMWGKGRDLPTFWVEKNSEGGRSIHSEGSKGYGIRAQKHKKEHWFLIYENYSHQNRKTKKKKERDKGTKKGKRRIQSRRQF
ncbi:hypothetical protein PVK06_012444 [Gossypium arboreum]|uniref:RNase H type-1 domain-containing protein n=1 Tax=Gossypium arboreum TaxID=29729 RepID=A0ABR0QCG8_GOSAR|nr:hypothetical protein PVK06_012444 [Gossypium arboreum]